MSIYGGIVISLTDYYSSADIRLRCFSLYLHFKITRQAFSFCQTRTVTSCGRSQVFGTCRNKDRIQPSSVKVFEKQFLECQSLERKVISALSHYHQKYVIKRYLVGVLQA